MSCDVPTQASNMASSIKWLLQNKGKTGTAKSSIYTTPIPITKANAAPEGTGWKLGKPREAESLSLMPTHHTKRRPLVVANARHSPGYGCALRLSPDSPELKEPDAVLKAA